MNPFGLVLLHTMHMLRVVAVRLLLQVLHIGSVDSRLHAVQRGGRIVLSMLFLISLKNGCIKSLSKKDKSTGNRAFIVMYVEVFFLAGDRR